MKIARFFNDKMMLVFTAFVVLSFFAQVFKVNSIVNVIYVISLLLVLAGYFLSGYITAHILALFFFVGLGAISRGLIHESDFFTHLLITLCIFICIDICAYVKITLKTYKIIATVFFISSIVLLVAYYLGPLKRSYFKWTDSICLNMPNPNVAGLWVTCFFIILFYSSFLFKGIRRVLYLLVAVALLPIVIATQSRNSYFACLFLVGCVIITKLFNIKKVPKLFFVLIATLPLIVFFFYMFVIVKNMDFWQEFFSFDDINKGINTRHSMWQRVLDNFGECFLIGNYYKYYNSQQHNSLITIFCRFGSIVTTVLCMLIYRSLKNLQENSSFYATLGLSAILFTGCFEASVFVGIAGMYLMLILVPACASAEVEEH